jgi:hypothetical protein
LQKNARYATFVLALDLTAERSKQRRTWVVLVEVCLLFLVLVIVCDVFAGESVVRASRKSFAHR